MKYPASLHHCIMANCKLCCKRLLPHAHKLTCANCLGTIHLKCLHRVSKTDLTCRNFLSNQWFCPSCISDIFPFAHLDDDDDFLNAVLDFGSFNAVAPYGILDDQNLIFNPFELNDDTVCPMNDIDPDILYYNQQFNPILQSCEYFLEDTFNKKIRDANIQQNALSLIHTNIRSSSCNLRTFDTYLDTLDHSFSFIGLSETWLKSCNKDLYGIAGYKGEHSFRSKQRGGGVSLLIKDSIEYFVRKDLSKQTDAMEAIFVDVNGNQVIKERNVIVEVIYRPPNTDIHVFKTMLSEMLIKMKCENKILYLLGDYNINLLNFDKHVPTQEFLDLLFTYSVAPSITKPTRVTSHSATLIDNIFTNNTSDSTQNFAGILYTDVTDHFSIFYINSEANVTVTPSVIKKRVFSLGNIEKFKTALQNFDWSYISTVEDPQEAYSAFHKQYNLMYVFSFPLQEIKLDTGIENTGSQIN